MRFLERFWSGCGHCHDGRDCPLATDAAPQTFGTREYDHGPALVGAVLLVFILPLATAIGGAFLAGRWLAGPAPQLLGLWQTGGAIVGFSAGVGLAKLVFWARRRLADGGRQ
jgi:hypothetical protein